MGVTKPKPSESYRVELIAVPGVPLVHEGDSIPAVIVKSLQDAGLGLVDGDILVVASKIISRAEGQVKDLSGIEPSERAKRIGAASGKDPRVVELMLREGDVLHVEKGVVETRHRLGFACTSAGIDRANAGAQSEEKVSLLPADTDASAARIMAGIREATGKAVAVIINDSFGIRYRNGSIGLAVGISGAPAVITGDGEQVDVFGRRRGGTISFADEVSAAASMLMGQGSEGRPVVIVRNLWHPDSDGKLGDLISKEQLQRDIDAAKRL